MNSSNNLSDEQFDYLRTTTDINQIYYQNNILTKQNKQLKQTIEKMQTQQKKKIKQLTSDVFRLSQKIIDQQTTINNYKEQKEKFQKWYSAQIDRQKQLNIKIALLQNQLKKQTQNNKPSNQMTNSCQQQQSSKIQLVNTENQKLLELLEEERDKSIGFQKRIQRLKQQIQQLKSNHTIPDERFQFQQNSQDLLEEVQSKKQHLYDLKKDIIQLKTQHEKQIKNVKNQLFQKQKIIKQLEQLNVKLQKQNQCINQQFSNFKLINNSNDFSKQYEELRQKYRSSIAEKHHLNQLIFNLQDQTKKLSQQIQQTQQKHKLTSKNLQTQSQQQIYILNAKINQLQLNITNNLNKLSELQQKNRQAEVTISQSYQQIKELQNKSKLLESKFQNLDIEKDQFSSKLQAQIKERKQEKDVQIQQLNINYRFLYQQNKNLHQKYQFLSTQISKLQQQNKTIRAQRQQLWDLNTQCELKLKQFIKVREQGTFLIGMTKSHQISI